ncbi:MAG: hypothetical protein H6923_05525 [Alphaproteobacteria bacterium]|nr:hypothetical protein [Alphaproteobacteria bacterium]
MSPTCQVKGPPPPELPPFRVLEDGSWLYVPLARALRQGFVARDEVQKVAVLAFRRWSLSLFLLTGLLAGVGGLLLALILPRLAVIALVAAAFLAAAYEHERELRLLLKRLEGPIDMRRFAPEES